MNKLIKKLKCKLSWFKYDLRKDKYSRIKYQIAYELHESKIECNVHMVKVRRFFNKITVTIYLERPGLFLGKRGERLIRIQDDLIMITDCNVVVKLKEYTPLPAIYVNVY